MSHDWPKNSLWKSEETNTYKNDTKNPECLIIGERKCLGRIGIPVMFSYFLWIKQHAREWNRVLLINFPTQGLKSPSATLFTASLGIPEFWHLVSLPSLLFPGRPLYTTIKLTPQWSIRQPVTVAQSRHWASTLGEESSVEVSERRLLSRWFMDL